MVQKEPVVQKEKQAEVAEAETTEAKPLLRQGMQQWHQELLRLSKSPHRRDPTSVDDGVAGPLARWRCRLFL